MDILTPRDCCCGVAPATTVDLLIIGPAAAQAAHVAGMDDCPLADVGALASFDRLLVEHDAVGIRQAYAGCQGVAMNHPESWQKSEVP